MRAWDQEIDLILKGDLDGAAKVYHEHRPDVSLIAARQIVGDVAKAMNVVIKVFEKKKAEVTT